MQGTGSGTGNIVGDPLFFNAGSLAGTDGVLFTSDDGLRLIGTSPALNTGTTTSATKDIRGVGRPIGAAYDMGAYEGSACTPTTLPAVAPALAGRDLFCQLFTSATFRIPVTGVLATGVWSSRDPSIVSVASIGGATCNVTAFSNGTTYVDYTYTNSGGCITVSSRLVTVAAISTPVISGATGVCVGNTIPFSSSIPGGVWSSLRAYASIDAAGIVTGLSAGSAMLRYTLTNASGCTTYVDRGTIVNPLPATPRINYAIGTVPPEAGGGICNGRTFTLVGSPTGGVEYYYTHHRFH